MAKIMISLPEEFLKELDRAAMEENRTRSEFMREAVRKYLEQKKASPRPIDDPEILKALKKQREIANRMKGKWDSTDFIRLMRDERR